MTALTYHGHPIQLTAVDGRTPTDVAFQLYDTGTLDVVLEPGDATRYRLRLGFTTARDGLTVVKVAPYAPHQVYWAITFWDVTNVRLTPDDFDRVERNQWTRTVLAYYINLVLGHEKEER